MRGSTTCAVISSRHTAAASARKGTSSTRSSRSRGVLDARQLEVAVERRVAVSGEVLAAGATPSRQALREGELRASATASGSRANARSPITGFAGLRVDVERPARSRGRCADRASSRPSAPATARVSSGVPASPSRRIGGHCVQGARSRCTRPPSWSIATHSGVSAGARACSSPTSARSCAGDSTLRANNTTPPTRPAPINAARSSGKLVPAKPANRS